MKQHFAVIGAGIAGLFAARQILQTNKTARVTVFERTRRLGGRVVSHRLGAERGIVELGAERFDPVKHRLVASLVEEYGLPTKPFSYALSPLQRGLHEQSRAVLEDLCTELADYHDSLTPRDRQRMSLEEAAHVSLGVPKFKYLVEMCGYDTLRDADINFEEGYRLIRHHSETSSLFGEERQTWLALSHGFTSLATALANDIAERAEIVFDRALTNIRTASGGMAYALDFEPAAYRAPMLFDGVVFAMPFSELQNVNGMNLSRTIRDNIRQVPLLKGFFTYENRWWHDMALEGRCFSTASMFRKVYFPSDAACLTFYCDGPSAIRLHQALAEDHDVHDDFLKVILDALPFALGADAVPRPTDFGFRFWPQGASFWRGGMNLVPEGCWHVGRDACICSDMFTRHPGWLEGALTSVVTAVDRLCAHNGEVTGRVAVPEKRITC